MADQRLGPTIAQSLVNQLWSPDKENAFQRDMQFAPGWSNWRRDFTQRFGEAPNIAPGGDYNYRAAWMLGPPPEPYAPDNGHYHGTSSAIVPPFKEPVDFKSPDHPTAWMESFMRQFGLDPNDAVSNGTTTPEMRDFMLNSAVKQMRGGMFGK